MADFASHIRFDADLAKRGDAPWEAYIAPTRPEHFAGHDPVNGDVDDLHGETYWFTFEEAARHMLALADLVAQSTAVIVAGRDARPYSPYYAGAQS
jgi:hypothetical protein